MTRSAFVLGLFYALTGCTGTDETLGWSEGRCGRINVKQEIRGAEIADIVRSSVAAALGKPQATPKPSAMTAGSSSYSCPPDRSCTWFETNGTKTTCFAVD